MARRNRRGKRNRWAQPQRVYSNAAGLDVGATEVYAAVRAERDEKPIRSFPTFTRDLHALVGSIHDELHPMSGLIHEQRLAVKVE